MSETQIDPLSGRCHAKPPFLLLDIESKVIKEECAEENVTFNLKAKGDEMKIGCSTIEESESTGTHLLVRVKEGGSGVFHQQK